MQKQKKLPWLQIGAQRLALGLGAACALVIMAGITPVSATLSETCATCHETAVADFNASFHARAWRGANDCQACHGNADQHLKESSKAAIISYAKDGGRSAEELAGQCLHCHSSSSQVAFWQNSMHNSAGLSCGSCHSGHASEPMNLKTGQTELCFSCHRDIRSQSNRQSHHPIVEGKVSCSDCHDPHGGFGDKMIKADSINDLCYSCHSDKRGPYMWEHPPVEENCMTCHTAHGSNHNKLLTRKTPHLCQSCHDWTYHPSTAYNDSDSFSNGTPTRQLVGRNCLNCHNNIHGSNGAPSLGLRYVR
jgi:DmsE family decaheme c-type cytochrome